MKILKKILILFVVAVLCFNVPSVALSPEKVTWDFDLYTIDLPEDVDLINTPDEENAPVYADQSQSLTFIPSFTVLEEDFEPSDFICEFSENFGLTCDDIEILAITTGVESPLFCALAYDENQTLLFGIYPDYKLNKGAILVLSVKNNTGMHPLSIATSFRVKKSSNL